MLFWHLQQNLAIWLDIKSEEGYQPEGLVLGHTGFDFDFEMVFRLRNRTD